MRTEVKIGLVSCVLIIAIVLTFAMFRDDTDTQNDAKNAETAAPSSKVSQPTSNTKPSKPTTTASKPSGSGNGTPVAPIKVNRPSATKPVVPSPVRPQRPSVTAPKTVTTTTAPKTPLNSPSSSGTATSGSYYSPLAPSNATNTAANKTTPTTTPRLPSNPAAGNSSLPSPTVRINNPSGSTTTNTATPTVIKPVVSKPRIYAVQEGDSGFYAIAQKLYGSQRYAYLIRNANRNAESNRLRVGQKLVIPPLPADAVNKTANNTAAVAASGARVHVVESDDIAWNLAKKYYGAGKYVYLIEKANPGVNLDVLIVGQKLVIPKFQPSSSSSSGTSAVASGSGRIHTVESGDSAWKLAERYYGSGKYVDFIRNANKGVDIDNLKVGQKLVIPASKTASGGSSSASSSSSSSTSAGGYTAPRPMFD